MERLELKANRQVLMQTRRTVSDLSPTMMVFLVHKVARTSLWSSLKILLRKRG